MDNGQTDKKTVRVTILGNPYTLRVAGDPGDVAELARRLDALMESIASRSGSTDPTRVAVLASLHLADRLHAMEVELASLKQRLDQKTERFSVLLDQALEANE